MQIAEKLKGLFVVFAGHFIRNAAQVIADTNFTQKGSLPFSGPNAEDNTLMLLEYVLRCLYRVCLHDNENFINKERFETLMEPLVDQLENQLGEENAVKLRVKELLVPLLAPMAVAVSDDYLWKALHYQLLLKTRDNSPHVRLGSLSALSALVEKLDYLALLPEAIPFLAELLEDDVNEVEVAAQTTIANMENMLGEP
jgi:U3 small nucleolar RNA-associated protein 10